MDLYARYRRWASTVSTAVQVEIGAVMGMLGAVLISIGRLTRHEASVVRVAAWGMLLGAPIAAFDASGAARWRGRPNEGWVRGALVLGLGLGSGVLLLSR